MHTQNHYIIGVDEVGRGPLLGDVVISAVCLPNEILQVLPDSPSQDLYQAENVAIVQHHTLAMLTDSKKLSEKKREKLFPMIQQSAIAHSIIKIPPKMIDEWNILQATLQGMRLAIDDIIQQLLLENNKATFSVMIDGNQLPLLTDLSTFNQIKYLKAIIQGDSKHACISASSVLAKVSRDNDMLALAEKYPNYGIEKHKGYPTKLHLQAIEDFGILAEHRRSFSPIKQKIQS